MAPEFVRLNSICVLCLALLSYVPFVKSKKWKGALVLVLSGLTAVAFEYLGVKTCLPYGCFNYSTVLGYRIGGVVPWTVLVAWTPLVLGVWSLLGGMRVWVRVVLGVLILILVDMVLDPGAVAAGFRSYPAGGRRYSIPWTNFL